MEATASGAASSGRLIDSSRTESGIPSISRRRSDAGGARPNTVSTAPAREGVSPQARSPAAAEKPVATDALTVSD
ncbi:MAG TPA: hypothetical protein VL049_26210 [Candidatus Dormibacteraeota bacterium]|nr:hypothetical protein [Candidatus Dormibacteraeota bacterium]